MNISQAAALSGLSVHAIRYYERAGVLRRTGRVNGVRRFDRADLRELAWIARARRAKLALNDVAATLDRGEGAHEHGGTLVRRLIALDERRRALERELDAIGALRAETAAELATLTTAPFRVRAS